MNSKKKSVLVFAYKYCNRDPRILREIDALVDSGYDVDYICGYDHCFPAKELKGVAVYPVDMERKRGHVLRYLYEYLHFTLKLMFKINYLYFKKRHTLLMPFVMPEMLIVACLLPKLFGAKILTDWEDPSYEVFLSKFPDGKPKWMLSLIYLFEKICVKFSDVIITPNKGFKRAFVARGHSQQKIHIVMNAPDYKLFNRPEDLDIQNDKKNKPFTALYNGSIVERHGLHVLIEALPLIIEEIADFQLLIYSDQEEVDQYLCACRDRWLNLNLHEHVKFMGVVHISNMPEIIYNSSVCIIPNTDTPFTRINFPQRIIESGLLKTPLVVSRLPGIQDYYDEESISFFEPGDAKDLADKVLSLYRSPERLKKYVENAYNTSKKLIWKEPFLKIVNTMAFSEEANLNLSPQNEI